MRAFYRDFYGFHANLCQYRTGWTRLIVLDPRGKTIKLKEYRSWRGAKIALGMMSDSWVNEITGKPL